MNEKQLREQLAAKSQELDSLLSKANDITADDYAKIQALNGETETLTKSLKDAVDQARALDEIRRKNGERVTEFKRASGIEHPGQQTPASGTTGLAGQGSALFQKSGSFELDGSTREALFEGTGGLSRKQIEAISTLDYARSYQKYLKDGLQGLTPTEYKTLQEGSDQAGGFTVPEQVLAKLIQKKPTPNRVADYCTQLTTGRDNLHIPRVVYNTDDLYTTGMRVTWSGEVPSSSTVHRVTDPVFGSIRIPIFTAMMSIPITNDLIEDSLFGLMEYLSTKFVETRDLLRDNMVLNGSGIGQPAGILLSPGVGNDDPAVINMTDPINAAAIQAMPWNVPEQYEENLRWVFNKTNMGKYIAGLADTTGRFLWGSGMGDSGFQVPAIRRTLEGYPVSYTGFMPDRATNATPIIFGDMTGYYLVERIGMSLQVLNEVYAEQNQKLLLARLRFGGAVAEPWRLKVGKQA
jgi:HK97 family phage major capsid protein